MSNFIVRNVIGDGPFAIPTDDNELYNSGIAFQNILDGIPDFDYQTALSQIVDDPPNQQELTLIADDISVNGSWFISDVSSLRTTIMLELLNHPNIDSVGNIDIVDAVLDNLGVSHYPISKDVLNRPEKKPGKQGRWEWRILGTGKAVPIQAQRDVPWRTLV